MSKEAYYFSHDANARNDEKIIKLRFKHGWEGYGIYWGLIERLRESPTYKLKTDYELIAFDMRTQCERIKSVIEDFDLFILEDEDFYSRSLMIRMDMKSAKSASARKSAQARWNKVKEKDANALQTDSDGNASKVKEKKEKESKGNKGFKKPTIQEISDYINEKGYSVDAEKFFNHYESNGWKVGKNKMQKWRNAVANWNTNSSPQQSQTQEPQLRFYKEN